jgi:hypothetical protein
LTGRFGSGNLRELPILNHVKVEAETLTLRHILSVPCPMCRAKPKERCTLTTGHPSIKTHLVRATAAAKVPPPENFGQASLRAMKKVTSQGLRSLFKRD